MGADRGAELLQRVMVIGSDGDDLGVGNGDLRVIRGELQMLLVLLRAVIAPRQREDQRVVALELAQPSHRVGVIRQSVVREGSARSDIRTHGMTAFHKADGDGNQNEKSAAGSVVCPTSIR